MRRGESGAGVRTRCPRPLGANAGRHHGHRQCQRALLHKHLRPHLDADCPLVSDANPSYHVFAREAGISHKAINLSIGRRVRRESNAAYHVQHVNTYHGRLRQWMLRFQGVATKYLANYLAWFRGLDTHRRDTPQTILFAAVGAFP